MSASLLSKAKEQEAARDYPAAEKLYREYLDICKDDADAWVALGAVLLKEQQFYDAADAYAAALDISPENPEYMYMLGIVLEKIHEYAEAKTLFEKAAARSDTIKYQFKVGDMLGYLGKYDEALVLYTLLAGRYPDEPGIYRRMSIVYSALGRSAEALSALNKEMVLREKIVRVNPSASAWYTYADTKGRLHLWEDAETGFRESLALEESADTRLRLGAVLIMRKERAKGREEFQKAAAENSNDFAFLMKVADVITDLELYEDAIGYYTKALELRTVHADAWAGIAYDLLKMGNTADAKAFFEMAKASAAVRELPWADKLHRSDKTKALDAELK